MQSFLWKSLKPYNTFGIDVKAEKFIAVETLEELRLVLQQNYATEIFILGGGSNMLLTEDIQKAVLHIDLKGKEVLPASEDDVFIKSMAGENWHQLVLWCIQQDLAGIENLSLIPGNAGTAPIQNIGAYGVEIKDVFESCEALDIQTLELKKFGREDCKFGYRDSIFKTALKGRYIICSITLRLSKNNHHLNTSYGSIEEYFRSKDIKRPDIKDISNAVINIRESKLPNPAVLGNSGSFFKNPVISRSSFEALQKKFPEIPGYKLTDGIKIPAGWLIEKAGFKGYRKGDAGVHHKQALVLVNYGNASGQDILHLSQEVQVKIKDLFDVQLQPEVNIF